MKYSVLLLAFLFFTNAHAVEANYYRFWQGFKKNNLTEGQFVDAIPDFMKKGVDLYSGNGISDYLVLMPPSEKPSFVPDEFALLAFDSKESYDKVRATPEGKQYGEDHWQIFERSTSKSAEMRTFSEGITMLAPNVAYNVLGKPVDIQKSAVFTFVGLKKTGLSSEQFLKNMASHLQLVKKEMGPLGMVGYLALATENYEVAYMMWESEEKAAAAFASPAGEKVQKDASNSLDMLFYKEAALHDGSPVSNGEAYKTIAP
ncbi:MAG: hypothetical protein AB7O96_17335 [Pseudobdellovibrionaceae bacterium]